MGNECVAVLLGDCGGKAMKVTGTEWTEALRGQFLIIFELTFVKS